VQPVNVDVLISSPAYQTLQAEAVAAPAFVTQPVVEAEALPHTASIASNVVATEAMCSLPSVSQYSNALFAELLNLLPSVPTQPAGNVMSLAKTELSPTTSAEVMQGLQGPQVPQLPATTALASSISWPGQATKPIVANTQPSLPSVVSVLISSPAYQPLQAEAVAAPAFVTQPAVEAEALPHTASIASTVVATEPMCSLPSVSQYTNEPERAMRRFDNRKQLDGESVAEYEQGLRTLYREASPRAEDTALKRKFEEGLHSGEMLQFLRLHARFDDFGQTVAKAHRFAETQEAVKTKTSVKIIENRDVDHNATPTTDQSVVKPLLRKS